ncbi:MAG: prephenate dehydrogenase [Chloroflexi bacterium]|nr:prephenate dehydrogenase [Chloroflexota bacterium]
MPQITLIGLGRVGTSIGLALKRKAVDGLTVIGHDRSPETGRQAQAKGAIDRAEWNLPAAAENADLILLCVPLQELRQAMQEVAPSLKPGSVVSDVAPLKAPVLAWAAELIPADRYFVGGGPILNPLYLHDGLTGLDAARADLFDNGLWALVPEADPPPEALKLLNDFARLTGATPFFVDALEYDSLLAGTNTLPALLSAALIQAVSTAPGWADARKLADRTFATATAPVSFVSPAAVRAATLLNQAGALHALDEAQNQLSRIRKAIAENDSATLDALLTEATLTREVWLKKRAEADWEAEEKPEFETPTAGQVLGQMIGLGRKKK